MLKEPEEETLSLEEKMHLTILEKSKSAKGEYGFWALIFLLLFAISFLAWINSNLLDVEINDEILALLQENNDNIMYISLGLFVFFSGLIFVGMIYSQREAKKLNKLVDGFIRKSYFINFETAIPKGANKVEKILNEAIKVFPELKETKREAEKKGKKLHYEINKEIGDFVYDLSLKTKSGEFFLVKFFETETFDELEKIVKNTNKAFKKHKVFRLIYVAKDFQNVFQDYGFEDRMNSLSRSFKLDLIEEQDEGYSMVWID